MKTIYKSFKGTILNTKNEKEVALEIPTGLVKVACLFAGAPSKDVTIKILDANGSAIIEASNYKDWEQRQGGTYESSKKPVNFQGGQKIRVVAQSVVNQTADWNFEVLLLIEQPQQA